MNPDTSTTIIGLVDAGGSCGGGIGGSDEWRLIFHLAGWRHPGSEVIVARRRCLLPVSEVDLRSLMDTIGPYSIVEAEIEDGSTAEATGLRRIVRVGVKDAELEQLSSRLQEPIVLHDAALGRLEYDRMLGWYAGRAQWCGQAIEIRLACARPEDPAAVLEAARRLFADQAEWQDRVREYAVEQLLPLKNDSWLDDDEPELSKDEFLSRMSLNSITVDESGDITFWHDDDDLFWGHAIQVSGSLSEGLTNADIPG